MTGELDKSLFQYCPIGMVLMNKKGEVTDVNHRMKDIFGLVPDMYHGKAKNEPLDFFYERIDRIFNKENLYTKAVIKTNNAIFDIRRTIKKLDGTIAFLSINMGPVLDRNNCLKGIISTVEDITDQQMSEEDREKLIQELSNQSQKLEELYSALKTLIANREKEFEDLEEKIAFNLKSLVIPYMEKLSRSHLNSDSRIYLDIALSNLNDIFSSFGSILSSKKYSFTPRELEVTDLVRQGKSNKEIAEILHISVRSVESHRRWIRRKLGLRGKNVNLRTYLLTFR